MSELESNRGGVGPPNCGDIMCTERIGDRALARVTHPQHSRLPGYESAPEIETVQASKLTEARFWRDHVRRLAPCRIAGAVKHWPAMKLWQSPEYLIAKIGAEREVRVRTHPLAEFGALSKVRAAVERQNLETHETMRFADFLQRGNAPGSGHLVLHAYPLVPRPQPSFGTFPLALHDPFISTFAPLAADVSGFPFLSKARRGRFYGPYRVFFFRSSFTDWHYHTTDETLMCQVGGAKEVLLLPPDVPSWDRLMSVMREYGRTFDHDLSQRFAGAALLRTSLDAGDALYIPPYWWHSVASLEDRLGTTVAACFRSPFLTANTVRYPAARQALRDRLQGSLRALLPSSNVRNAVNPAIAEREA